MVAIHPIPSSGDSRVPIGVSFVLLQEAFPGSFLAKALPEPDLRYLAVIELEKINVPQAQQSPCAPAELRETPFALQSSGGAPPVARRAKGGGAGGRQNNLR
jgi:hypothetical protein